MRGETNGEEEKQGTLVLFNKKVSFSFSKRKVSFSIHELVFQTYKWVYSCTTQAGYNSSDKNSEISLLIVVDTTAAEYVEEETEEEKKM